MMFLKHAIIGILISVCVHSTAQTKTYTLKAMGLRIGKLEAYHLKKNNFDFYATHSTVDFITIKADVKTEVIYEDGILIRAIVTSKINGEAYSSKTIWKKDHYDIDCHARKYSHKDTTLTKPIKWSAGKMYFEIPKPGVEIYTESYGKLSILEETKKNTLKMTTPESKQIYSYSGDYAKLVKIEVVNNIKNFDMIPDK
jgi:hypothetical protein